MVEATLVLFGHVLFGLLGSLVAFWVLIEIRHLSQDNFSRIKLLSISTIVLIFLSYILAGYWYVTFYGADKQIIKLSSWSFAHTIITESKEHFFFFILLLVILLYFLVRDYDLLQRSDIKNLATGVALLIFLLGLTMDAMGAIMAFGTRVALEEGVAFVMQIINLLEVLV